METKTKAFGRQDGSIEIGGADYRRIDPVSGLKLDGSWTFFRASSGSTGTSSGSVASSRTIVFTPEGTFTRSGYSSATSSSTIGDTTVGTAHGRDKPIESGTYAIEGYTLTLTSGDGKIENLSLYLPDKDDHDLLVINGSHYLRDGRSKN